MSMTVILLKNVARAPQKFCIHFFRQIVCHGNRTQAQAEKTLEEQHGKLKISGSGPTKTAP